MTKREKKWQRPSLTAAARALEETLRKTGYYAAKDRVARHDAAQARFLPGTKPTER